MILIAQRKLLPGIMMLLSFILLVLFLCGAVGTGIQLFGKAQINQQCNRYVFNRKSFGATETTLAFLQQQNICKFWFFRCPLWLLVGGYKWIENGSELAIFDERLTNNAYRSVLAGRVLVLDHWSRVFHLDDDNCKPGEPESVRSLSSEYAPPEPHFTTQTTRNRTFEPESTRYQTPIYSSYRRSSSYRISALHGRDKPLLLYLRSFFYYYPPSLYMNYGAHGGSM